MLDFVANAHFFYGAVWTVKGPLEPQFQCVHMREKVI